MCSKVETKEIAKLAHTYGSWTTTIQPTCSTQGAKERKCTACSYADKQILSTTSHSYGSKTIIGGNICYKESCTKCGYVNIHYGHDYIIEYTALNNNMHTRKEYCSTCKTIKGEETSKCVYKSEGYMAYINGKMQIVYRCTGCRRMKNS